VIAQKNGAVGTLDFDGFLCGLGGKSRSRHGTKVEVSRT
jgi:hypothetical protein